MKPSFTPNLGKWGRIVRGLLAVGLLVGAWFAFDRSRWLAIGLVASGGFVMFEALRGWCALRACGIKTKI